MVTCHHPFGISPDMIADFDREQDSLRVSNRPVRDIDRETFWDFVNASEDFGGVFTPEALESLGR